MSLATAKALNIRTVADTILRRRAPLIVLVLLATVFFGWHLRSIVLDGSIERIMLKNDEARLFNAQSNELFGGDEIITIVVQHADSVWNEPALRKLDDVSQQLAEVSGVSDVYSLTNAQIVERKVVARSMTLLERLDRGIKIDWLRTLAWTDPFVRRNLVTEDGQHTALNVRLVPLEGRPLGFKKRLTHNIRQTMATAYPKDRYHIAGWPVIQSDLTVFMERDMFVLIPALFAVVMLLFAISFRRLTGVVLPVAAIVIAQVWTIGGVAAAGKSLSIVTYSLPIIIIAIGATYCIHMIAHIFREFDKCGDRVAATTAAFIATSPSILLSGATTMIGFAALKFSRLEAIDEFGSFAIWGIGCSVFAALVFLPCMAAWLPMRQRAAFPAATSGQAHPQKGSGRIARGFQATRFLATVLTHRRAVWIMTALVLAVGLHGVSKIRVETAPTNWFPQQSDIRQSVSYVNENMVGITPYNVVIDTGVPEGVYGPEMLKKIDELQRWLERQSEVDTTNSIVEPIKLVDRASRRRAKRLRIPPSRDRVNEVMELIRDHEAASLGTLITSNGQQANVIMRAKIVSSERGIQFADRVNEYLHQHFGAVDGLQSTTARITGTGYLTFRTNIEFTNGLAISLGVGVALISLVMIALLQSWKLGLLAMIPNLVPLLINYAILGLGDLTLNAATSITGCIAIGIAVDDTIHFLVAFRNGMQKTGNRRAAVLHALEEVGKPMLITTAALFAGFSVLLLSSFLPVVSLGLLVALTMVACLACDTLLLPVLLTTEFSWFRKPQRPSARCGIPETAGIPKSGNCQNRNSLICSS